MSEKSAFKDTLIKLAIICVCGILYAVGGMEEGPGKWVRRVAMPLFMAGGMFWFSRDWKSLVVAPMVGIGASCGYGADAIWFKIIKRAYCGLILGGGSAAGDFLNKRFLIAISQTVLVTIGMVLLGVYQVLPDARSEELAIGCLIAFLPVMSARRTA